MKPTDAGILVLLLLGSLCSGCGLGKATAAPAEVSQAVDALLLTAAEETWNDTYASMTAPELRQNFPKEEYEKLGRLIHVRLGKLVSKNTTSFFVKTMNGIMTVDATYDAQFDQGKASIRTSLVKTAGQWRFRGFWIASPQLLEAPSIPCASCGKPCPKDAAYCPACGKKMDQAVAPPPRK